MKGDARARRVPRVGLVALLGVLVLGVVAFGGSAGAASTTKSTSASGSLDCNGFSTTQSPIKNSTACTDVRGFATSNQNTWGGRFYDNGHYIGHDEPDLTFLSDRSGSGDNVSWTETLPRDPIAMPTVKTPGSDVTHWFELSVAPWFSMALCNSESYPLLPCTPNSDSNAPTDSYPGGGSSFLEMQFYPPGDAPFVDSVSCDNEHWCASLHINDLECTLNFATCNPNCEEPTNFAFVQRNGIPTGPPSPQEATTASFTPNGDTLLMNPGDQLRIHIWDAPAPGGGHALEVSINDLTTHQNGYMQASAANGYMATSMADCSGTPFNYEPEYNTAARGNIVPWAALQTDISTQFEVGHWEPCTKVDHILGFGPGGEGDPIYGTCIGPYESSADSGPEASDAACYPLGDTHGTLNSDPNEVAGCLDDIFQNGDLDFDGTSYWPDWPIGTKPTDRFPGSFVQSPPTTEGQGYSKAFFQTDVALSESTCTSDNMSGCTVPPSGPGNFYPYWSEATDNGKCTILFGNVSSGKGVNDFGKDAQYGEDLFSTLGYPEFESQPMANTCK